MIEKLFVFGKNKSKCWIFLLNILRFYFLRFCNKRQALKNSVKKFKSNQINEENESTSSSLIDTTNYLKSEQEDILP